ncbi:MAG: NlpC/P60 family protein [Eubacteriales bacterium]
MQKRKNPTGIPKRLLCALSVGLLLFQTSCSIMLREVETQRERPPETETEPPRHDFRRPETETEEPAEKTKEEHFMETEKKRPLSAEALEWVAWYEETYGAGTADELLMERDEITALNRRMLEETPTMRDMTALPATMSGSEVRTMIETYHLPMDDRYVDGQTLITPDMREEVLANRNLGGIPETVEVRWAVIVKRCSLRGAPTEKSFHKHGDKHYDSIQETELICGVPAAILHTSTDGRYIFVLSYFYSGWIPTECAALCTADEYAWFSSPQNYITVVSRAVECGGVQFDMGAVLPYVGEDADFYTVQLPKKHPETGRLFLEKASLSKEDAVYGSLDFTMRNYYAQAFAYLGTYYGWGGSGGGVDCSGFVCAVFRSFGLYLPRNTGEQSRHAGTLLSLESDPSGVLDTIARPAAIYRPGHVMLYLGKKDGVHTIIHAPQGGEQVCVAPLSMAKLTVAAVFG